MSAASDNANKFAVPPAFCSTPLYSIFKTRFQRASRKRILALTQIWANTEKRILYGKRKHDWALRSTSGSGAEFWNSVRVLRLTQSPQPGGRGRGGAVTTVSFWTTELYGCGDPHKNSGRCWCTRGVSTHDQRCKLLHPLNSIKGKTCHCKQLA